MTNKKYRSKMQPLAVFAIVTLVGLVLYTTPKLQHAEGFTDSRQIAETTGPAD